MCPVWVTGVLPACVKGAAIPDIVRLQLCMNATSILFPSLIKRCVELTHLQEQICRCLVLESEAF